MFTLILSPQAAPVDDVPPKVEGNVLTYRGQEYDFSPLDDGEEIEVGEPFIGPVKRVNGVIHATLTYQYNWETSEDWQPMDWAAYTFSVERGVCQCPIVRKPVVPAAELYKFAMAHEPELISDPDGATESAAPADEEVLFA